MTFSDVKKIDLHMHTTVSDGTDSPLELLDRIIEKKIDLFSVTDHDAIKAGKILKEPTALAGVGFITGAEFSCKDEKGKYHILGYNYDPDAKAINDLVNKGHGLRMNKLEQRLSFLSEEFGFSFPEREIETLRAMDNPGKPHIGNLMTKLGFSASKEDAIKNFINKRRFATEYLRPEETIRAVLESGGIPVLAHPCYGTGDQLIIGDELKERVDYLTGFGLKGLEGYYSGFSPKLTELVLGIAKEKDLYVTAGSDYHGSNKLVELGDTGLENLNDAPDGLKKFIEAVLG